MDTKTKYEIVEVEKGCTEDKNIVSISSYMGMYTALKGGPGLKLKSSHVIKTACCGTHYGEMHVYEPIENE